MLLGLIERSTDEAGVRAAVTLHVTVEAADRQLGPKEQQERLLHLLATHAGIVFSREALLARIWRGETFVTVRSVDTLVKRL